METETIMSTIDAQGQACCGCLINPEWNYPWGNSWFDKYQQNPIQPIYPSNGLTNEEKEVLQFLKEAWNKFIALDKNSGDNIKEYQDAIHRCQQIIGLRVARRVDPDVWKQPE
jgi:hypothetical protein